MEKRGELEIAINKRTIERAVFLLLVVVLGVLLIIRWDSPADPQAQAAVLEMQVSLNQSTSRVQELLDQLAQANNKIETLEEKATLTPATPAPVTSTPAAACSGELSFDWEADGEIQTPPIYNKVKIDALQTEIDELKDEEKNASTSRIAQIKIEIEEKEDEIRDLEQGDSKLRLRGVSLTVTNDQDEEVEAEYLLCWTSFDCSKVKTEGTITVSACDSVQQDLELKIPTFLEIEHKSQVLQLVVTVDEEKVFEDSYTFRE